MGKTTKVLITGKSEKDHYEKLNLFIDVEDYQHLSKEAIKSLVSIVNTLEEIKEDYGIPLNIKTLLKIAINEYL